MGTLRRKDLKPARKISDARFLAGAMASATKHQKRLERQRRAELLEPLSRPGSGGGQRGGAGVLSDS